MLPKTAIIPLDALDIFAERWPEFTFIAVLMAIVAIVVWRISAFYYTRIKVIESKTEHADCKRHGEAIGGFDRTAEKIFDRIEKSLNKIDRLEKAFVAKNPEMFDSFAVSNSPLQLNQLSKDLMADSGADKILEDQKGYLVSQIEKIDPSTAYDVEESAYRVLLLSSSESWFNPIKTFIFNNPVYKERNINLDVFCFIMSLPLRDHYLGKHREIVS